MAKVLTKNLQIVCLANSRKLSGRCVAGKLLDGSGQWIRPVSAREHEEVSLDERRYDNGEDPVLRDVVRTFASASSAATSTRVKTGCWTTGTFGPRPGGCGGGFWRTWRVSRAGFGLTANIRLMAIMTGSTWPRHKN